MFNNLVESDSHREELARKSRFFLGTLVLYALLFMVGGVVSIYAYDAHLENQSLEVVTLLPPIEAAQPSPPARESAKDRAETPRHNESDVRTLLMASVNTPYLRPDRVSSERVNTPPVRPGIPVVQGNFDRDGEVDGPIAPGTTGGTGGPRIAAAPVRVEEDGAPPPPRPSPSPTPVRHDQMVTKGVITGEMLNRPNLPYPPMARMAGAQGTVAVQIVIDETGKVTSARAISGHPLLRGAAEQAAYQARFSPTKLSGVPVKVSGTITFNFVLQR